MKLLGFHGYVHTKASMYLLQMFHIMGFFFLDSGFACLFHFALTRVKMQSIIALIAVYSLAYIVGCSTSSFEIMRKIMVLKQIKLMD